MTVDRKIVVGVEDIQAITLECTGCKVRVTLPPDSENLPTNCPMCNKVWIKPEFMLPRENPHLPSEAKIPSQLKLVRAIAKIRKRVEDSKVENTGEVFGFRVLMEFAEPTLMPPQVSEYCPRGQ